MKSTRPYSPNELILEYCGDVVSRAEMQRRLKENYSNSKHNFMLNFESDSMIDSGIHGSAARFANHSCSPNAQVQKWNGDGLPRMGLFAIDFIPTGTEVTYDYDLFESTKLQTCFCGAELCRGFFGTNRFELSTVDQNGTTPLTPESLEALPLTEKREDTGKPPFKSSNSTKVTQGASETHTLKPIDTERGIQDEDEISISRPVRRPKVLLDDEEKDEDNTEEVRIHAKKPADSSDQIKIKSSELVSKDQQATPRRRGRPKGFKVKPKDQKNQSTPQTPRSRTGPKSQKKSQKLANTPSNPSDIASSPSFPVVLKLPSSSNNSNLSSSVTLSSELAEAESGSPKLSGQSTTSLHVDSPTPSQDRDIPQSVVSQTAPRFEYMSEFHLQKKKPKAIRRKKSAATNEPTISSDIQEGHLSAPQSRLGLASFSSPASTDAVVASADMSSPTSAPTSPQPFHTNPEHDYELPEMVPEPRLVRLDASLVTASFNLQMELTKKKHYQRKDGYTISTGASAPKYTVFPAQSSGVQPVPVPVAPFIPSFARPEPSNHAQVPLELPPLGSTESLPPSRKPSIGNIISPHNSSPILAGPSQFSTPPIPSARSSINEPLPSLVHEVPQFPQYSHPIPQNQLINRQLSGHYGPIQESPVYSPSFAPPPMKTSSPSLAMPSLIPREHFPPLPSFNPMPTYTYHPPMPPQTLHNMGQRSLSFAHDRQPESGPYYNDPAIVKNHAQLSPSPEHPGRSMAIVNTYAPPPGPPSNVVDVPNLDPPRAELKRKHVSIQSLVSSPSPEPERAQLFGSTNNQPRPETEPSDQTTQPDQATVNHQSEKRSSISSESSPNSAKLDSLAGFAIAPSSFSPLNGSQTSSIPAPVTKPSFRVEITNPSWAKPRRGRPPNSAKISLVSLQHIAPNNPSPTPSMSVAPAPAPASAPSPAAPAKVRRHSVDHQPVVKKARRGRPSATNSSKRHSLVPTSGTSSLSGPERSWEDSHQSIGVATQMKETTVASDSNKYVDSIAAKQPRTLPPISAPGELTGSFTPAATAESAAHGQTKDSIQPVNSLASPEQALEQSTKESVRQSSASPQHPNSGTSTFTSDSSAADLSPGEDGEAKRGRGRPRTRPKGYWAYTNRKARGEFGPGSNYAKNKRLLASRELGSPVSGNTY